MSMSTRKQAWIGTIPLFIFILLIALSVVVFFSYLGYTLLIDLLPLWSVWIIAIICGVVGFGLFLNIPIPRIRTSPTKDLKDEDKIAEGAWCAVYTKNGDSTRVVKQLFFCGWGHNDYRKHKAFVLGKEKICGKWNPLILWFLHDYMILYQLIGLKRRLKFEHQIEALPNTYAVNYLGLRYEQTYVPYALTPETCPADIDAQFQQLNSELEQCGLYLDDVHAGNVRITENGRIRIVDGELYSGGEEWIKSKVVVLFNGEMVSNMAKVLGNERIVAWVDHRQSVDGIVAQSNHRP